MDTKSNGFYRVWPTVSARAEHDDSRSLPSAAETVLSVTF